MISLPSKPTVATFFNKVDAKNKTPLGALKCNELSIKFCGDIIGHKIRWRCSKQRKDLKCPAKFYTDLSALYLTYFDDMYNHKCKQSQQITQLESALKSARMQQLSSKKSNRASSPGEFEWKFPPQSPVQEETEAVHSLLVQFNQVASDYMNKVGLPHDAKEIINSLNGIISPQKGNSSSANEISPFTLNEHQTTQNLQTNQSNIPCDFISSNKKRLRTTSQFESPALSFKRHCTESERSRDCKSSQSPSLHRLEQSLNKMHNHDTFKIQPLQCPIGTFNVEFASQEVQTDPLPSIEEAPSKIPLKSLNLETFKKVFMRYTSRFTQVLGCAVRDNFHMREIIKDELVRNDAVLTYLKSLYEESTLDDYNICYIQTLMEKLQHKYLPEYTMDVEREFSKYVDIQFTFFEKPLEHDATIIRNRLYKEGNESAANTQLDEEKYNKTFTLIANDPLVVLKREYVYPL